MRVATPAAASSYAFVNPVIALLLAWAVGDEVVGPATAVAAALVVGSVLLTRGGHADKRDSPVKHPQKARPQAGPSKLRIADSG
jgi:drug/metabolite transporter (DMT)-like permease